MKKNVVRLNESQLRQIVKESVKRVLMEDARMEEEENNPWQELEKAKRSGNTKDVLTALKKIENMLRSSGGLQDADATIYGRKVRTSTNNPNGDCLWQSDEEYDDIDA